jgi:hypothetical protein
MATRWGWGASSTNYPGASHGQRPLSLQTIPDTADPLQKIDKASLDRSQNGSQNSLYHNM